MGKVVVVGAGIAGLGAALVLARCGHTVVLCERDATPAPAEAATMWAAWHRPGTPQARHLHGFPGRVRTLLRDRAPDVLRQVLAAGAGELVDRAPDGSVEPGDADLVLLLCRRPVFEGVLRRAVEAEPGVQVRTGCGVDGVLVRPSGRPGLPRVVGVRTDGGEDIAADVVVDASGRRSRVLTWLAAAGARPPAEESCATGVVYYGRHFALRGGAVPRGAEEAIYLRGSLGYLTYGLLSTDNHTLVVNVTAPAWDRELRALRYEAAWMAAVRSIPALAPWVAPECAVPIGSVEAMGELRNTWRRFVVGGQPVAVGLHVVGDALCHTNPSYGKGASLALAHAVALADALDAAPNDPLAQALALDGAVAAEARQWYEFAVATDRWRQRAWRGEATVPPTPEDDVYGFIQTAVPTAATMDPVVFRAHRRQFHVLDLPAALVGNAEMLERARRVVAVHQREEASPPVPMGPDRATLLALLASIEPCARSTRSHTITDP